MHWPFFIRNRRAFIRQPSKAADDNAAMPPEFMSLLGELLGDIQLRRFRGDDKVLFDEIPDDTLRTILRAYARQRTNPAFNLHNFVAEYFKDYLAKQPVNYHSNPENTVQQHINELWNVLTRSTPANSGSLIALPYPYVVPGGRFSEQFYWDGYFIMLGLRAAGRYELMEGMVKNYAFMIRKLGYIPTANRTYFLSRSQPPFFSHMVRMLAQHRSTHLTLVRHLPYLLAERRFWMRGAKDVTADRAASQRVVRLPGGSLLNRYYDDKQTPRPEAYKEDTDTARAVKDRPAADVYLDLRAAAESGWDFSSRWFRDGKQLRTVHTSGIIPVDLNCLLADLERTIADAYRVLRQGKVAGHYDDQAQQRIEAINRCCWSESEGFYFDYDFAAGDCTHRKTIAAMYPLFSKIASREQAAAVVKVLDREFLREGGLVTTTLVSGQQWDAPNGWAPLHWIAIQGLRNYEYHELANEVKRRWIATNLAMYKTQGKLVEKYNVVTRGHPSGGEYPLQDGFGWTNGVLMALLREDAPGQDLRSAKRQV